MVITMAFGDWLKRRRRQLDLTQKELARRVSCSEGTIRKIEGNRRRPSTQLAQLLATHLEIPPQKQAAFITFARTEAHTAAMDKALAAMEIDLLEPSLLPLPSVVWPQTPVKTKADIIMHNLPPQPTPFIGRSTELAALDELLANPDTRLITIVGAGGMGKTRLALACAESQLQSAFSRHSFHGVFFVDLASLDDVEQIISALAHALRLRLRSDDQDKRSPKQQILDYLRRKRLLLLLDNFEYLLSLSSSPSVGAAGGADLVAEILQAAPEVQLLVTSRERLHLQEEHLFAIEGLEYPDGETTNDVTEHTAVQLFLQSAHRVQKNLNLHTDDLTHLSIICQLVEGMPLALELAAGWVDVLSLAEIGTEISHGLDVLETEVRNVPQRQRSLRILFDHSWQRLSREEQEVLSRFSLFRGGCTREAVQATTSASLRMLSNLVNKSLIQYRQQNGRYYIHALLRQYAAEKLATDPIVAASAGDSYCAYYCATLGQWKNELKSARQAMTVAAMDEDYDNMRAAWEWGVVNNKLADLAIALNGWGEYHEVSGRWPEGEMIFQTTAETIQAANDFITEPSAWIPLWVSLQVWQIKFNLNRMLEILGYQEHLEKLLKQSLELLAGLASNGETFPAEEALVRLQLGRLQKYGSQQKIEEGRIHLEVGLRLYRKMGDKVGLADALYEIGWCDISNHLFKQAREFMRESQTILREVGDLWRLTRVLFGLGFCAKALEDFDEALEIFTQLSTTLTSLQTFGNVIGLAHSLMNLDSNLVHLGKYAEAQVLAKKYLAIYNDLGTEQELAYANTVASFPLLYLGQYTAARKQAQKGLDLGQKLNQQEAMEWSSMILGWVALAEQVYDEASQRLQESIVIGQELGDIPNVGQAKATLALAMRGLGNHTDAQRCLIEALRTAKEERNKNKYIYLILVKTVPTIALLLADQNDKVRAVELYALAQTHPMVANGQWFQDVVGQYIEDVAATLQADVVTAAKTRGQASNLWKTAEKLLQELTELGWDEKTG